MTYLQKGLEKWISGCLRKEKAFLIAEVQKTFQTKDWGICPVCPMVNPALVPPVKKLKGTCPLLKLGPWYQLLHQIRITKFFKMQKFPSPWYLYFDACLE